VFSALALPGIEDNAAPTSEYTQLPVSEDDAGEAVAESAPLKTKALSMGDKWQLLKPMIPRYMAPLCKCLSGFYTFGQIAHSRAHVVFVYLVSPPYTVQHLLFTCREVRIHHQSRRCANTCIPCPYVRVIPSFRAHYSFSSGLLPSLAGTLSSTLLNAFLKQAWLACVSKHCFSLSFIPLPRTAGSSNTRNFNTLNHSRAPSNRTFVGISVWVFP
jgi:hypothetical protein